MKRTIAALAALLLGGCAAAPYWERVPDWKLAGEVRVTRVDRLPWANVEGVAYRRADGSCDVLISKRAANPSCVEEHERRHCEGWDHPRYPVNLACSISPLPRI